LIFGKEGNRRIYLLTSNTYMNKYAIIVAGGSGTRMGGPISKQYLEIGGKPILMHTLEVFYQSVEKVQLILVLPENDFSFWEDLCVRYRFSIPHSKVRGGSSRFQSVKNGLDSIQTDQGIVAIHDAVRPFVEPKVILESFQVAEKSGSAIAVVPLKDSLRKLTDDGNHFFRKDKISGWSRLPRLSFCQK
jgi:2-C-methyl-D-erythritol 4-phosphate cytidylyltransferase